MLFYRGIRGPKPHSKKRKLYCKAIILILVITIILSIGYEYVNDKVMPTLSVIAEMKVRNETIQLINESVKEVIEKNNINTNDLITYYNNSNGEIYSCSINTIKINEISTEINERITFKIKSIASEQIEIPLGNIIINNVYTDVGPNIKVKVAPIGTTNISYEKEFYSTGINQLNNRVWLNINTSVQIVLPIVSQKISIKQQVVLIDQVINGIVPPSYVNVPEDSILDVAPSDIGKE